MKQKVVVMGVPVTVQTSATDPKYVHDVAAHVDSVATRVAANLPPLGKETLAILTALEIADELFKKASNAVPEGRRPQARVDALLKKIDTAIGNDQAREAL